ncbi:hypothetical protein [Streptomyces sp. NPDC088725]|uniref:hypothetical protein n=1 Tax=Streptomyces sp. NPDC088725 TaxID=3365873 RepID=UPI0037F7F316
MRRATAVRLIGAGLAVGAAFVLAPVGMTPKGCGDLSNGRLCIDGPIGGAGAFTIRYLRRPGDPGGAEVRLGYQRKDNRITAFPDWFGTARIHHGTAQLTGTLDTAPGECIRGVLLDAHERPYVTRWKCA